MNPKNISKKALVAQGTIEYLVVIAVVVVLSLVVVALVINVSSSPSQQISSSSDKLGNVAVGGISIVEAVSDLDGDSLIMLSNNSSEGITLKKITVGENDNNYDDYISGVDSVPISLTGLASSCPCESGQKSVKCEFVFEYLTKSGLTKIERRTISVQCTNSNEDPSSPSTRLITPTNLELGTLENPWIINDCLELQDMNQHLDGNYILGNDIDCAGIANFSPIGGKYVGGIWNCGGNTPFTGSFNGNNYTIYNLSVDKVSEDYPGDYMVCSALFGATDGANIYDLTISGANVASTNGGSYNKAGAAGFVGYAANSTLSNLTLNNSSILSSSNGSITFEAGGIVAYSYQSTLSNLNVNDSVINGGEGTGGVIGVADTCSLDNLNANSSTVIGTDTANLALVGGVIGYISRIDLAPFELLSNATFSGSVTGPGITGGIVGGFSGHDTGATVSNLVNSGDVHGGYCAGSLFGTADTATSSYSSIIANNSSSTGNITCDDPYHIDADYFTPYAGCPPSIGGGDVE